MRIFLTGATGYIGTALCRRLAADGHELSAVVRETSDTATLEELGVECHEGDITDRYSMRVPMSGADWVIHAAAHLDFAASADVMHNINVQGSDNVASLAFKLGVGRFLALSSIASFGGSPADGSAGDESSEIFEPMPSAYSATKRGADLAIAAWAEKGLEVNTVYPSLVYGPPGKKMGANVLLRQILKGRLPAMVGVDRRARWIFLDDLIEGLVQVIERAEPGEDYMMTGDVASIGELVDKLVELGGAKRPKITLSPRVAGLLAWVVNPVYKLRGYRSPLIPDQIRSLYRHWNFDDRKAREELDWQPRDLDAGLPPTIEHLLAT